MEKFKKFPVFFSLLTVLVLAAGGEGWCLWVRLRAAHAAQLKLDNKRAEIHTVAATSPAPTKKISDAVAADLARTERALATMQLALKGAGPAAEKLFASAPPAQRPQAWQDIATFVETSRQRAQKSAVIIKADERFGFAEYANEGPENALIPAVHRERLVVQYLIDAIFEARPRQLLFVQRERPLSQRERDELAARLANANPADPAPEPAFTAPSAGPGADAGDAPEIFEIDPRVSARVPGFVDATAFRFAFTGQSASLRTLLNKLGLFELPLVVRAVEVEPAPAPAEEARAPGAKPAVTPLVSRPLSRFTVTVEFIEPAAAPAAPPPAP